MSRTSNRSAPPLVVIIIITVAIPVALILLRQIG